MGELRLAGAFEKLRKLVDYSVSLVQSNTMCAHTTEGKFD